MAKAISEGAINNGATVTMKEVTEAQPKDLLDYDAIIIGTPSYFGYMAGSLKDFLERAWLTIANNEANMPYAVFSSSASGQKSALDSVDNVLNGFNQFKQFKFHKETDGIVASGKPAAEVLEKCRQLGKKIAKIK
jgi:multimeric flavodoxin WrbA